MRTIVFRSIVVALISVVVPFCMAGQKSGDKAALNQSEGGAGSVSQAFRGEANSAAYKIGPTDTLKIDVWKEPEVSGTVIVRPDGKISLPLINDIQAAGLTPMMLARNITEALKKFISDPNVTVIVTEPNSQTIYVVGEVRRPGAVKLLPHTTVLDALASAGGPSEFANRKKIFILRRKGGKEVRYAFNYRAAIKGDLSQNIALEPGDTIVVP